MRIKTRLISTMCALIAIAGIVLSNEVTAYEPPIGIPDPTWGSIHPIDTPAPAQPVSWPGTEVAGYYYIDNTHPSATDSGNPYGYPNQPRKTIPHGPYAAGSYVELHGGPYPDTKYKLTFNCTEAAPCWLRGTPDAMPTINGSLWVVNSAYVILEHLDFNGDTGGADFAPGTALAFKGHGNHLAIRNSIFQNRAHPPGPTSAFVVISDLGQTISDVVVSKNLFRELGDWQLEYDLDFLAISAQLWNRDNTTALHHIWILGNTCYHVSSNCVQINSGNWVDAYKYLHHVYIGRNVAYENRQAGFWSKQASDIIMSQNISYANRQHGPQPGDGMGFQYGPHNLWIIFNEIYDSNFGIRQSDTPANSVGHKAYIVGNLIYNIHPEAGMAYSASNMWRPGQAIALWHGYMDRYIVNNTIYDVHGGINTVYDGPVTMLGNIISDIDANDFHVSSYLPAKNGNAQLEHTLFHDAEGDIRFNWNWTSYTSLALFKITTGQCDGCKAEDPVFTDKVAKNFQIRPGSPAQDAANNATVDVYAIFEALYGIDIRKDIAEKSRPHGKAMDIGAFEINVPTAPKNSKVIKSK